MISLIAVFKPNPAKWTIKLKSNPQTIDSALLLYCEATQDITIRGFSKFQPMTVTVIASSAEPPANRPWLHSQVSQSVPRCCQTCPESTRRPPPSTDASAGAQRSPPPPPVLECDPRWSLSVSRSFSKCFGSQGNLHFSTGGCETAPPQLPLLLLMAAKWTSCNWKQKTVA